MGAIGYFYIGVRMGKHYGLDALTLHELLIDVDKEWVDPDGQPRGITETK